MFKFLVCVMIIAGTIFSQVVASAANNFSIYAEPDEKSKVVATIKNDAPIMLIFSNDK